MALSVVLTAECQQFAGANTKKEYGFIGQPDKTAQQVGPTKRSVYSTVQFVWYNLRKYVSVVCITHFRPRRHQQRPYKFGQIGRLAQLVERTLSMREVEGSKPSLSTPFFSSPFFVFSLSSSLCYSCPPSSRLLFFVFIFLFLLTDVNIFFCLLITVMLTTYHRIIECRSSFRISVRW